MVRTAIKGSIIQANIALTTDCLLGGCQCEGTGVPGVGMVEKGLARHGRSMEDIVCIQHITNSWLSTRAAARGFIWRRLVRALPGWGRASNQSDPIYKLGLVYPATSFRPPCTPHLGPPAARSSLFVTAKPLYK